MGKIKTAGIRAGPGRGRPPVFTGTPPELPHDDDGGLSGCLKRKRKKYEYFITINPGR